jgi:hypothetical protein
VLATYHANVNALPVCTPVYTFNATRTSGSTIRLDWENPEGQVAIGRRIEARKWAPETGWFWPHERFIYTTGEATTALHTGAEAGRWYSYTIQSHCAYGLYSNPAGWDMVSPWRGGAGGASGQGGEPDPTPTLTPEATPGGPVNEEEPPEPPTGE